MSSTTFRRSIQELDDTGAHWQRQIMPPDGLHYCPPSAGGWGIFRAGLLVPESLLLFVSPAGCGRHGAISSLQLGYRRRLYFLHIDEVDIVTGRHMERIPSAVAEIMASAHPRPKAMIVCASCIDDLLGSDYDRLAGEMAAVHGIPFRVIHMNPIATDGKMPPTLMVQRGVYDFLERSSERDAMVNVVGNFVPIDTTSEFYEVMARAGVRRIGQVGACATIDEFRRLSRAGHNILIRPEGRLAVQHMAQKLGIPYCFAPAAYSMDTIDRTYRLMEQCLGVALCTQEYREQAEAAVSFYRRALGPLTVAVGSRTNVGTFELARALAEYGFRVRYVFADMLVDFDLEHVAWLKDHVPDLVVLTNIHPTMVDFVGQRHAVDLAIGLDAGYFCPDAHTVPLTLETQPYGYRGVVELLREMAQALESPRRHREQMYAAGTVA
ncbi:MAG: hypothetical protein EPO21_23505 [Chloroflexota bacterium]|nr:MAG: hypothetical protein EPO21_23505 [Chloroflexota bacterium]